MTTRTITAIAKETGIARSSLIRWRDRENLDIQDPAALARRIANKPPRPDSGATVAKQSPDAPQATADASAESYSEARRRREIAVADRAETLAAREKGLLVPAENIRADGQRIGYAARAELEKLCGEMPGLLGGRPASEIDMMLRRRVREILDNLSTLELFPSE